MTTDINTPFEDSYYEASVVRPLRTAALTTGITADICVIGGGFTGISAALELAKRGRQVVLLEANAVGWGASGRNGGQLLPDFPCSDLGKIADAAGLSEKALFDLSLQAVQLAKDRIAEYQIDCDFSAGTADAAVKPLHLDEMKKWAETVATKYGHPPPTVLDAVGFREIVASRRYCGGSLDNTGGHLHPLKYTLGLAAAAAAAGVRLYEGSTVIGLSENKDWTIRTTTGTVRCQHVVYAGNAYGGRLLPKVGACVMPVGTYIGATKPLGDAASRLIADNRCVCDSKFVLDYYRCSADKRLLFGGRASYSARRPANLEHSLHRRMVAVFPQLADAEFDYVWGGFVAITQSRFPHIGRVGRSLYFAHGFSGHGVAMSGFAGRIIADAVCAETEKFDIFSRVKHRPFPGGALFRTPLLVLGMLYYRLRDML